MTQKKTDRVLFAVIIISYVFFFISTMARANFWIDVFSPVTVMFTSVIIFVCMTRLGRYWIPSCLLATGIMFYAVADILKFVGLYILHSDIFDDAITFVYLLPNYFFGASVALYFIQKLKGRELYQFLINTFTLTIIGFVLFRRALIYLGTFDLIGNTDLVRVYLYFAINLFILIMIGHMIYMIAYESGLKATNFMLIGILVYILLDIPYTLLQAMGKDPENIYTNLIYTFCMMLMAYGIFHQVYYQHVFTLKVYEYTEASARRTRIRVGIGLLLSVAAFVAKWIDQTDFFYLVLAMLAYWITTATFLNSALNEQILKQQDILTGLYNRRYSATRLEESIKMRSIMEVSLQSFV